MRWMAPILCWRADTSGMANPWFEAALRCAPHHEALEGNVSYFYQAMRGPCAGPLLFVQSAILSRHHQLHPVVVPQVSHFKHVPFRTMVKLLHSVHWSPV